MPDLRTFLETITCKRLKLCNGNCTIDNERWKYIFMPLGVGDEQEQQIVTEHTFKDYTFHKYNLDLVKEINDNYLVIDRDVLIEAYIKDFENQRNYCPKYRDSDSIEKVKDLPAEIKVKLGSQLDEKDSSEESDWKEHIIELQNQRDEILSNRIAEEVEKRMRIVLDEYFNKNQGK